MSCTVSVSVEGFRATFFSDFPQETYPDAVVSAYLRNAQNYVSNINYGRLRDTAREYAIYLMTAHLLTLKDRIEQSGSGFIGYETSARVDNVSVSLAPPISRDELERWFELTGYGLELRAQLRTRACVPFWISAQ
jgi:hypothetical protein